MAKVTAPLFSFGARGKLANSIVYFPWKGVNAVRQYVIPANPNTEAQGDQRDLLTAAVLEWHEAGYTTIDKTAFNALAGLLKTSMSGFNRFCQEHIKEGVAGNVWERIYEGSLFGPTANSIRTLVYKAAGGNAPTVYWGTSKTSLLNSAPMVNTGADAWEYTIPGLSANSLYYATFDVGTSETDYGRLGLYNGRTLAA